MRQDAWYEEHDEEDLFRRLSVNQFCVLALCDARRAAAFYLASAGQLLSEAVDEMEQIVSHFKEVSMIADSIQEMVGLEGSVTVKDVRSFWTKEKREAQAKALLKMQELERKAIQIAARVL